MVIVVFNTRWKRSNTVCFTFFSNPDLNHKKKYSDGIEQLDTRPKCTPILSTTTKYPNHLYYYTNLYIYFKFNRQSFFYFNVVPKKTLKSIYFSYILILSDLSTRSQLFYSQPRPTSILPTTRTPNYTKVHQTRP